MNRSKKYRHLSIYHPNAADYRYFRQEALDIATTVVSVAGFVSAMVFLVTLS